MNEGNSIDTEERELTDFTNLIKVDFAKMTHHNLFQITISFESTHHMEVDIDISNHPITLSSLIHLRMIGKFFYNETLNLYFDLHKFIYFILMKVQH